MKKKDRGLQPPEIVFIGPEKNRMKYTHKLFLVKKRDADGVVTELEMLKDDVTITIKEGLQFMTGYVLAEMNRPDPKHANYVLDDRPKLGPQGQGTEGTE